MEAWGKKKSRAGTLQDTNGKSLRGFTASGLVMGRQRPASYGRAENPRDLPGGFRRRHSAAHRGVTHYRLAARQQQRYTRAC